MITTRGILTVFGFSSIQYDHVTDLSHNRLDRINTVRIFDYITSAFIGYSLLLAGLSSEAAVGTILLSIAIDGIASAYVKFQELPGLNSLQH